MFDYRLDNFTLIKRSALPYEITINSSISSGIRVRGSFEIIRHSVAQSCGTGSIRQNRMVISGRFMWLNEHYYSVPNGLVGDSLFGKQV
jgi:hypothetical protein